MPGETGFRLVGGEPSVILVRVFVNGRGPYEFALDTGASRTVPSTELSRALGIETSGSKGVSGADGKLAASLGRVHSLAVAGTTVNDLPVAIVDLAPIAQAMEVKLAGVLGYNYLKNFSLTINYPRGTLRLDLPSAHAESVA